MLGPVERHLLGRRDACTPASPRAAPPAADQRLDKDRIRAGRARSGRGKYSDQLLRDHRLVPAAGPPGAAAERVRAAEGAAAARRSPEYRGEAPILEQLQGALCAGQAIGRDGRMKFSIFQESRRGRRAIPTRTASRYCYSRDALLLVVADGMGGHLHGEVAAQIAVRLHRRGVPARGQAAARRPGRVPVPRRRPRARADPATRRSSRPAGDAAHHLRRLRGAGRARLLGARRRFAPVPHPRRAASWRTPATTRWCSSWSTRDASARRRRRTHPERNQICSASAAAQPPRVDLPRTTRLDAGRHPAAVLGRLLGAAHAAPAATGCSASVMNEARAGAARRWPRRAPAATATTSRCSR